MTESPVILDTSFLIACLCKRDVHHGRGRKLYAHIRGRYRLVIPDIVFGETVSVLARRSKEWKFKFRDLLNDLKEMCPRPAKFAGYMLTRFEDILALVEETDGSLDFNDALLVVGAREEGIGKIATFDRDFEGYLEVLTVPDKGA